MILLKHILFVSEPASDQTSALERAVTLAENNNADLTVATAIPSVPDGYLHERAALYRQDLEALIEPFLDRLNIRLEVLSGPVFLEVIRTVLRNSHDLVIKVAENPPFMKMLFGTDDMHLLRKCPCPVWLMKTPERSKYSVIVAAVDVDPLNSSDTEQDLNKNILDQATSLALSDFASLHLVHAWEPFAEGTLRSRVDAVAGGADYLEKEHMLHQQAFYRLGETLRNRIGEDIYDYLSPTFHLLKGPAKKLIPELASQLEADLVVMGTVARTGIAGLFIGNTAEAILDQLACSVLAVKPPGFVTPVKLSE